MLPSTVHTSEPVSRISSFSVSPISFRPRLQRGLVPYSRVWLILIKYVPKLFGLKIREYAEIHRWQDQVRERLQKRIALYETEREEEGDPIA